VATAGPLPLAFVAMIRRKYNVPFVSPVVLSVIVVVPDGVPVNDVQVVPLVEYVTEYEVTVPEGGVNETEAP